MQSYYTQEYTVSLMSNHNGIGGSTSQDSEKTRLRKLYDNATILINKHGLAHNQTVYALIANGVTLSEAESIVSHIEQTEDTSQANAGQRLLIMSGMLMTIGGALSLLLAASAL